ncbi:unnamed protein product [Camellia sinensis]
MVFSSIPAYLDPSNWQQQQQNPQIGTSSGNGNPHLPPPSLPPPPPPHQGDGSGSVRPGSVADQARMANIPMPEAALKCPRCESTNTKFCYFNNHSLTQPWHFCRTCRRYWTRGGALRSVLVGGGCRRNKRSKGSNSSKSPVSGGGGDGQTSSGSTSAISSSTSVGTASLLGLTSQIPPLRFMAAPLSQLTDHHHHHHHYDEIGLNYSGISAPLVVTSDMNTNFHFGSSSLGLGGRGRGGGIEQWRLQQPTQISPIAGLDFPGVLYPFQGGVEPSGYGGEGGQVRPKPRGLGFTTHQLGSASLLGLTPQIPPLRFMAAPLSQLTDHHHHHYGKIRLNYSGISAPLVVTSDMNMNFHLGSSSLGLGAVVVESSSGGCNNQLRCGVEPSGYGGEGSQVRPKPPGLGFTTYQLGSVKMEDNQVRELNLSRQFLGIPRNDQY